MTPSDPSPDTPGTPVVTVPDDARDLHRDVRALQRERRAARRRSRARGMLLTRRWDRFGLSGPLVIVILLVVAAYGALPTLLRPSDDRRGGAAEALASPTVAAGTVGGLLPEGRLDTPGGRTTTRDLDRPSALLLVPTPCSCEPVLTELVPRLTSYVREIRVITSGAADPEGTEARSLRSGQGRGQIDAGVDVDDALTAAYAPSGVTLVLVGRDGTVLDVVRDLRARQGIPALQRLR